MTSAPSRIAANRVVRIGSSPAFPASLVSHPSARQRARLQPRYARKAGFPAHCSTPISARGTLLLARLDRAVRTGNEAHRFIGADVTHVDLPIGQNDGHARADADGDD